MHRTTVIVAVLATALTQRAAAWNSIGHMAISKLAYDRLEDGEKLRIHELLKKQHRGVVDVVKAGSTEQFFRDQTEIRDAEGDTLALTWLNSDEAMVQRKLTMRILVSDAGEAVDGALVTSRIQYPAGVPIHSQAVSESDGRVELELDLVNEEKPARDLVVFVRATHGERSVTRKYRLKAEGDG